MVKSNQNSQQLAPHYLFPEIQRRVQELEQSGVSQRLISLGVGDTTHPIPKRITEKMSEAAHLLSTAEGYIGYGPEQGSLRLRKLISETFYAGKITPEEIFISDGAKCDIGRLLHLFHPNLTVAVQDPTYPVYVDSSVLSGHAKKILYLPCGPENGFFPNLKSCESVDLIYFCSPNNPTGSVATKEQLEHLIHFALERRAVILFDSAYAFFIKDKNLPFSVYSIPNAKKVVIEIHSFSKLAGFSGLRLGWTVVPKEMVLEDGAPAHCAWKRLTTTFFNGASSLSQAGGIAALSSEGLQELKQIRDFYLENALLIKETFKSLGLPAYGGMNSPYVWVDFSPKKSWDAFEDVLYQSGVISVPGRGFGPGGEGYLRFSAFAKRENVLEALARLTEYLCAATF